MNDSEVSFNGELLVTVDGTVLLFYCITHCRSDVVKILDWTYISIENTFIYEYIYTFIVFHLFEDKQVPSQIDSPFHVFNLQKSLFDIYYICGWTIEANPAFWQRE